MRRLLYAIHLVLAVFSLSGHAAPPVRDLTLAFDAFHARTAGQPLAERIAAFRRTVGAQFPEFYGDARGVWTPAEQDARIGAAITGYPAIRQAYLQKARDFGAALPRYLATFQQRFPDYRLPGNVWFVHGLGEMDGGTRELAGRHYLVFTADGMARYHGDNDEAAFFYHELFHTYHEPSLAACQARVAWYGLWTEGLATYVSQVMAPRASDRELLLDFPAGMVTRTQAVLPAALAQLDEVLDSTDEAIYAGLFRLRGDDTALPARRGYYLGYLVAQEAAVTHDLAALARLGCDDAHALVTATVRKLRAAAR